MINSVRADRIEPVSVSAATVRPRVLSARRLRSALTAGCVCAFALLSAARGNGAEHAIAMHGAPAYGADFDHFAYVNPTAPKGGRLVEGILGTFDSLNPLIVRGVALQQIRGYVIESLMARGYDEPFTLYGLLAKTVETDAARTVVTFTLDPTARFSDGTPVTPEDVIFSWDLLRQKGRPNHRGYYGKVTKAEQVGERGVRFDLTGADDRELPLILALMPVLPKHAVDPDRFEETTFTAPIGSGPYLVKDVDPGRSVTLARNRAYWGEGLAVNRGLWNFDEVRFEFYRDANVHFDAFRRGLYDAREETDPTRWKTGYDFPAARDGRVVAEALPNDQPKGMEGFVFNTRRPLFADVRVREALGLLFDFEWINRNYFFDLYRRTGSYFEGSELSARGRPAGPRERALLAPFPDAVRADFMDGSWQPTATDASGNVWSTIERHDVIRSPARGVGGSVGLPGKNARTPRFLPPARPLIVYPATRSTCGRTLSFASATCASATDTSAPSALSSGRCEAASARARWMSTRVVSTSTGSDGTSICDQSGSPGSSVIRSLSVRSARAAAS